jgi:uncharacterized lipoprotein YmbA
MTEISAMKKFHLRCAVWFLVPMAIGSFLAGCKILPEATVDPTRYYVLNGPATTDPTVTKPAGTHQIGLRPVELPGHLRNHKAMVVRTGANELRFEDFALWAEPLEAGVNRVLKERLLTTDTIGGVSTYPFSVDVRRDYDVVVRVLNCEGLLLDGKRGVARFAASYDIVASGGAGQVVARRTFTAPDLPWDAANFGALARLLSEDLAKLSDDIAANLPK